MKQYLFTSFIVLALAISLTVLVFAYIQYQLASGSTENEAVLENQAERFEGKLRLNQD